MNRINELIKSGQTLFRTNDLALLWRITNRNTLYTAIQRAINQGVLSPIQKGLYTTQALDQVNPFTIGSKLVHEYTYLSTETILVQNGIIFQSIPQLTYVTSRSYQLRVLDTDYRFRQMKPQLLHNRSGVTQQEWGFVASTERAVADMLYYNPAFHFDNPTAINWDEVKRIREQVHYS